MGVQFILEGYPHAGNPPSPYPMEEGIVSRAFSPLDMVRQPSSQPAMVQRSKQY